jgi:hypothetical protein
MDKDGKPTRKSAHFNGKYGPERRSKAGFSPPQNFSTVAQSW